MAIWNRHKFLQLQHIWKKRSRKALQGLRLVHTRGPMMMLAAIIGVCGGLTVMAFHSVLTFLMELLQGDLFGIDPWSNGQEGILPFYLFLILPPLGALLSGFVVYRFAPEEIGHGIDGTDATIDTFHNKGGNVRKRVVPVKFIASIATIASGGSAGYEGPVAQIGSGIGSMVTRFFRMNKRKRRILILAGAAASLGAVFKAPLGGALTSVEVLYREDFETDAFLTSIIASVIAYTIYAAYVGTEAAFAGIPHYNIQSGWQLLSYVLLGVACVPASWFYIRFFHGTRDWFKKLNIPVWLKPAIGAMGVSVLWLFYPQVISNSWHFLRDAMYGNMSFQNVPLGTLAWIVFGGITLAKIMATSFTVASGASGGVFGPSLFIGGMLGASFGNFLHSFAPSLVPDPGAWVLVGMGAFFAGAAKAPLASVVMVCEMTGSYSLLAPLMIASVIHISLSKRWALYDHQVENKFHSPAHRNEMQVDVLMNVLVSDILRKDRPPVTVTKGMAISEIQTLLANSDAETFPVLNESGSLCGVLHLQTLRQALFNNQLAPLLTAEDLMHPPYHLRLENNLHLALKEFIRHGTSELPVIDRDRKLCGTMRYLDISNAYDQVTLKGKIKDVE